MTDGQAPRLPRAGATIAARYRLERRLAGGGMGVVFEATDLHDPSIGRVAVKILRPEVLEVHDVIERFQRETSLARRIQHPNVVRVLEASVTEDHLPFMVMELLRGRDVSDELKQSGPFSIELAVHIVRQAARGVAAAHALRIIHRDLKPSNLFLLAREGAPSGDDAPDLVTPVVKVLDFGVSKALDTETHMTATNLAVGTPLYMSPEQVRSAKSVDVRTDVWALGVILFQLLTRRTPFEGESAPAVAASIVADAPLPLAELRPDLPRGLVAITMHLLAKKAAERAASAEEVIERLAPFDGIEQARDSTAVFAVQPRQWRETVRIQRPTLPLAPQVPIAAPPPPSYPGLAGAAPPPPSYPGLAGGAPYTPAPHRFVSGHDLPPPPTATPSGSTNPSWTDPRPASFVAPAPAPRSAVLWIVAASIFVAITTFGVVMILRNAKSGATAAASTSSVATTAPRPPDTAATSTDAPRARPMIEPAPIPSASALAIEPPEPAPSASAEPTPSAAPSATSPPPPSTGFTAPPKKTCAKSRMILVGGKLVCP